MLQRPLQPQLPLECDVHCDLNYLLNVSVPWKSNNLQYYSVHCDLNYLLNVSVPWKSSNLQYYSVHCDLNYLLNVSVPRKSNNLQYYSVYCDLNHLLNECSLESPQRSLPENSLGPHTTYTRCVVDPEARVQLKHCCHPGTFSIECFLGASHQPGLFGRNSNISTDLSSRTSTTSSRDLKPSSRRRLSGASITLCTRVMGPQTRHAWVPLRLNHLQNLSVLWKFNSHLYYSIHWDLNYLLNGSVPRNSNNLQYYSVHWDLNHLLNIQIHWDPTTFECSFSRKSNNLQYYSVQWDLNHLLNVSVPRKSNNLQYYQVHWDLNHLLNVSFSRKSNTLPYCSVHWDLNHHLNVSVFSNFNNPPKLSLFWDLILVLFLSFNTSAAYCSCLSPGTPSSTFRHLSLRTFLLAKEINNENGSVSVELWPCPLKRGHLWTISKLEDSPEP
ncbi:LOW QUALITY PROTEIN: hypothetical protein AAY473_035781 [Plecturocebus cupreus]